MSVEKSYENSSVVNCVLVILSALFTFIFVKFVDYKNKKIEKNLEKHSTGDLISFGNESIMVVVTTNRNTTTIALPMPGGYNFKYSVFNFKHNGHEYVACLADSNQNENLNFIHSPGCVTCQTTSKEIGVKIEQ